MKSSFCIDLQRFMLIPTKFPLTPDIIYKLALCPRFDSWWHHNKKELLIRVTPFLY